MKVETDLRIRLTEESEFQSPFGWSFLALSSFHKYYRAFSPTSQGEGLEYENVNYEVSDEKTR
ncbi:MAG: hypothetical protein ACRCU2_30215 [Planktothrix sp.]